MRSRNKPRIFITLHPRGKNSLRENRTRLGYAAYHWGILISPKHSTPSSTSDSVSAHTHHIHTHFDVTDSIYIDPLTNETKDNWRFRERNSPDPVISFQILARVYVGKLRLDSGGSEGVRERLGRIPLPRRDVGREIENCVTWTKAAIEILKDMGVLEVGFDVQGVMDDAMGFADECLGGKGGFRMGGVLDYTGKGMDAVGSGCA